MGLLRNRVTVSLCHILPFPCCAQVGISAPQGCGKTTDRVSGVPARRLGAVRLPNLPSHHSLTGLQSLEFLLGYLGL